MLKLTNYAAVETWRTLNIYTTAKRESAQFWDTSNQYAQGRIEELKRRLRSGIFEIKLTEEKRDVKLDRMISESSLLEQSSGTIKNFEISYSLRFLYPTTKKISMLMAVLQKIASESAQRIWVFARSRKLVCYLQQ